MRRFLVILLSLILFGSAVAFLLPWYINRLYLQGSIVQKLEKGMDLQISIQESKLKLYRGLGLSLKNIVIRKADGQKLLSAEEAIFQAYYLPLFKKQIKLRKIILIKPVIYSRQAPERPLLETIDGLSKGIQQALAQSRRTRFRLHGLEIIGGEIKIVNEQGGLLAEAVTLSNFNFRINRSLISKTFHFLFKGDVVWGTQGRTPFSLSGSIERPKLETPPHIKLKFKAERLMLAYLWSRLDPGEKRARIMGMTTLEANLDTTPGTELVLNAQADFEFLNLEIPQLFRYRLRPGNGSISAQLSLSKGNWEIKNFELTSQEVNLSGNMSLALLPGGGRYLSLKASTPLMPLEQIRRYIPVVLLDSPSWDYLTEVGSEGQARIANLYIRGSLSQLAHLDETPNYDTVGAVMEFQDMGGDLGGKYLSGRKLTGIMELKDGHLYFKDFKGYYGNSRVDRISGVLRDVHTSVNFLDLTIKGEADLAEAREQFFTPIFPPEVHRVVRDFTEIQGRAETEVRLKLSLGSSQPDRFTGWTKLQGARFKHKFFSDPAEDLQGTVFFSNEKIDTDRLAFRLGKSPGVVTGGFYDYAGSHPRLDMVFSSPGLADTQNLPVIFSRDQGQRTGKVTGKLRVSGPLSRPQEYKTNGELKLNKVEFPIHPFTQPLEDVVGSLNFQDQYVAFRMDRGLFSHQPFRATGSLKGFAAPVLDLWIKAPNMDLATLFAWQKKEEEENGRVGSEGPREISGHVSFGQAPFRNFQLDGLEADYQMKEGKWRIYNLSAQMDEGLVQGEVNFSLHPREGSLVELKPKASALNLDRLLTDLGQPAKRLSGRLDLSGELTGSGKDFNQLLHNLSGPVSLRVYDGRIHTGRMAASVLSMLEILSLLEFQLPKFDLEGLRFHEVTADVILNGDEFRSDNFFMDCGNFTVSAAGRYNAATHKVNVALNIRPIPFPRLTKAGRKINEAGKKLIGMGEDKKLKPLSEAERAQLKKQRGINFIVSGTMEKPKVVSATKSRRKTLDQELDQPETNSPTPAETETPPAP